MNIRKYDQNDLPSIIAIWNEVVEDGVAFPQEDLLEYKMHNETQYMKGILIRR